MIHAAITAIVVFLFGPLAGLGSAVFFVGREHTQAEYRWIAAYGGGKRANLPYWGGFDPRVWSLKSILDFALPLALATLAWILL